MEFHAHSLSKNCNAMAVLLVVYPIFTSTFDPFVTGDENRTWRAEPITGCFSVNLNCFLRALFFFSFSFVGRV